MCGRQKQSNDPHNNQHNPQYANHWAPLTRKRHILPHPAQSQHTNHWAPRTRKRHQQEHRPQRPTERSAPTQHAKGRTGDCPGPREETITRRNVTQGGAGPPRHPLLKGALGASGGRSGHCAREGGGGGLEGVLSSAPRTARGVPTRRRSWKSLPHGRACPSQGSCWSCSRAPW